MTTLAELRAALDAQALDISAPEDVLARATRRSARRTPMVAAAMVAAVAAAVVVATVRGSSPAQPADTNWHTFRTTSFSVRYPPTWNAATYQEKEKGSFHAAIVFLSDQPMSNPCTTPSVGTYSCRFSAVRHLEPGGVAVSWYNYGFTSRDPLADADGQPTTIGGVRAKVSIGTGCMGGDGTAIVAAVARPNAATNLLVMSACVRAERDSKQVDLVLRSMRSMRQ